MTGFAMKFTAAAAVAVCLAVTVPEAAAVCADTCRVSYSWHRDRIDGRRTGVSSPSADNVTEALGSVSGNKYYAPSGKIFKGGSVAAAAALVIDAQPVMAPVKQVIGYSPEVMTAAYPESGLSNLFVDTIMDAVEKASGKHVDVGIVNFGGIRVDMPEGDIFVDDIMSMFPFKNSIVYVSLKGSRLREILDSMAEDGFQVLGGLRVVAENGRIVSAEVGGEPLEDEKIYGLATITFLLHGGDDLFLGENVEESVEYPVDIYDVMMDYITAETEAGRDITYGTDGRVVIR